MHDKKEAIINAALKLFTTRGFHNTPTSLIAREAGVANGTLFNYFETKQKLIDSIYIECKISMMTFTTHNLAPEMSIREKARTLFENTVTWALQNKHKHLFYLQFSASPFITPEAKHEALQKFEFVKEFCEFAIKQEIMKDYPIDLLISFINNAITGVTAYLMEHEDDNDARETIDKAFKMLWDGLKL